MEAVTFTMNSFSFRLNSVLFSKWSTEWQALYKSELQVDAFKLRIVVLHSSEGIMSLLSKYGQVW